MIIVSINRTQPAFTRLPWRGTPCPCFHARALLQVDIILTASKQLRIRHLNQYAAHLILTLRQYFQKIFYRLLTRCIQCIRIFVTMLPLIIGNKKSQLSRFIAQTVGSLCYISCGYPTYPSVI